MTNKQCAHCPWKKSTVPDRDIPNGYTREKHCALKATIAKSPEQSIGRKQNVMACHETPPGGEKMCAGWAANQLGPGNNIGLRLMAVMGNEQLKDIVLDGEQHKRFEDTIPKRKKA